MQRITKSYLKILTGIFLGGCLLFFQEIVLAASDGKDLVVISGIITEQVTAVASLLVVVAYVAGVGFSLGGIIQFKAHKDNPTQVALSKPIVLLVVGACLLFLPTIMKSAGQSIFGEAPDTGAKGGTF